MRVCGIELKGSEAVLCLLDYDSGVFNVPECRQRSFTVPHSMATDVIREFQFAMTKLCEDYKIEQLVIVERPQKGKLAGSATSFKLEASLQLIDMPVSIILNSDIKEKVKNNHVQAEPESLGLKKFQTLAFKAAYAHQYMIMGTEEIQEQEQKPATLRTLPKKKTPWDKD